MKKVNVYYKKNGTCVGCEGVSDELAAKLDENIKQAYSWDKQPFPSYRLTNNNAEIRRLKKRIENLTATQNTEFVGWKFNGGEAVINEDKNRLQLIFDEKPSEEQRTILKSNGFRWAPSDKAWQRQLNHNAFYAANRIDFIKPESGEKPTDLQPKTQKRPSRKDEVFYVNKIFCGNALDILKTFPPESVNMCVTSPPYYGLRDYGVEAQIGNEQTPYEYIQNLLLVLKK